MLQQMQHVQQESFYLYAAFETYIYWGLQQMQQMQHVFLNFLFDKKQRGKERK